MCCAKSVVFRKTNHLFALNLRFIFLARKRLVRILNPKRKGENGMGKSRPTFGGVFVAGQAKGKTSKEPKVTLRVSRITPSSWGSGTKPFDQVVIHFNEAAKEKLFSNRDKYATIAYSEKDKVIRIEKKMTDSAGSRYRISQETNRGYGYIPGVSIRLPKSLVTEYSEIVANKEHITIQWYDEDEIYLKIDKNWEV